MYRGSVLIMLLLLSVSIGSAQVTPPAFIEQQKNFLYWNIKYVPDDYGTIQEAIDQVNDDVTVIVRPGTYVENLDFLGKQIRVVSEHGPDSTVIDGNGVGSVVTFQTGEPPASRLKGFTIQNGNADYGGGIYCNGASPTIIGNIITGNSVEVQGGGIYCRGGSAATMVNNIIHENTALLDGGGIYAEVGSPVTVVNNTLHGNTASFGAGGGIFCGQTATITSTIVWNNNAFTDDQIYDFGTATITYCDIEGGWPGTGNIDENPLFINPLLTGNFHIVYESPCRDAGDSTATLFPPEDYEGDPRVLFNAVDIGADEVDVDLPAQILLVPDGYPTIQSAIDSAFPLDTVLVAPGTYVENIDFVGKVIVVTSEFGPDSTIIDGDSLSSVVSFQNSEAEETRLEGFTVRNGYAEYGGGIFCEASSPTIAGNRITDNHALEYGGGISCSNHANPVITSNTISDNTTTNAGGGGIRTDTISSPSITNNTISGNTSGTHGGGIKCEGTSSPSITNNILIGNSAALDGGGINADFGSYLIATNNTFSGNSASTGFGGGLFCGGNVTVTNSIFWGNTAFVGYEIYAYGAPSITYCDVQGGGIPGAGNIDADPLFVTGTLGGYYLSQIATGQGSDSPCVDEGDPLSSMIIGTTRTDAVQDSGIVDIGYHYPY